VTKGPVNDGLNIYTVCRKCDIPIPMNDVRTLYQYSAVQYSTVCTLSVYVQLTGMIVTRQSMVNGPYTVWYSTVCLRYGTVM
jgi:hypothetical protein